MGIKLQKIHIKQKEEEAAPKHETTAQH